MDEQRQFRARVNWADAGIFAASAGLTLVEPRSLRGWRKHAYWAAVSLLTGASSVVGVRNSREEEGWYAYAPARGSGLPGRAPGDVGQLLGVAGVTFGLREPFLKADAWTVDTIRSWGVKRPRLLLAVLSLLAGGLAVAVQAQRPVPGVVVDDPETHDLDPRVRQVVAEILAKTDEWGASELRAQFGQAKQVGEMRYGYVQFEVPDDVEPLPVDSFVFPVHGRGEVDGVEVTVSLHVEMGRLAALSVEGPDELELRLPADTTYEVGMPQPFETDDER